MECLVLEKLSLPRQNQRVSSLHTAFSSFSFLWFSRALQSLLPCWGCCKRDICNISASGDSPQCFHLPSFQITSCKQMQTDSNQHFWLYFDSRSAANWSKNTWEKGQSWCLALFSLVMIEHFGHFCNFMISASEIAYCRSEKCSESHKSTPHRSFSSMRSMQLPQKGAHVLWHEAVDLQTETSVVPPSSWFWKRYDTTSGGEKEIQRTMFLVWLWWPASTIESSMQKQYAFRSSTPILLEIFLSSLCLCCFLLPVKPC